jgi:hypothetical protein
LKEPNLTRYTREQLDAMLWSYRTLAREHLESGHWALAKWATRMTTLITVRLSELEAETRAHEHAQLSVDDAPF